MRVQFKIQGENFKDLAKLIKRLQVFTANNSVLYIIIQRPSPDNPHGVIRFYINGVTQIMMMVDCNLILSHMTYKSIEDYAVFQVPVESFFKFIYAIEGHECQYVFALKKKGDFKFLQASLPQIEHTYRTIINQTSISHIGAWTPIIDPQYKMKLPKASFTQAFTWANDFQILSDDICQFSYGRSPNNKAYFRMNIVLEKDTEIKVDTVVEPEIGEDVRDERNIGKVGMDIMKKVLGFNDTIYLQKKKEESEYSFDIWGNVYHIQVKFPTTPVEGEERESGGGNGGGNGVVEKKPVVEEKSGEGIKIQGQGN